MRSSKMQDADALTQLLTSPHARGAFALRTVMRPPFCLRILAGAPVTVLAPVKGRVCVVPDGGEFHWIGPGDVAVACGPDPFDLADDPETETTVVIQPGQHCESPEGRSLHAEMMHGVRTWGNDPEGPVLLLVGAYESEAELSRHLCRQLPPVLSLKQDEWDSTLVSVLCEEMAKDEPGQAALLDRMIDLVLIGALKAWMSRPREPAELWQQQRDPVVGRALKLMRQDPAQSWTVESLGREIGLSRSALARRFHEVVGEAPMAFLTRWRMALAADWICEPDATVGGVAERLGYSTPFAFSTAFKRVRGMSPMAHRREQRGHGSWQDG
ncbi:AraC family transcriptional regulator [Kiritimatiellaeota bacterium B1221]|nr:AraC family transcriptional regulator [Kiritimatiellaeota bacterium B1221]